MKTIIVYFASLEKAHQIVDYAAQVAKRLKLNIHFVYNIDLAAEDFGETKNEKLTKKDLEKQIIGQRKAEIGRLVEKQDWAALNITAIYSVYTGTFPEMLQTLSDRNDSELMLFPVEDDKKAAHGKNISQILRILTLPVWCFSAGSRFKQVKTMVYASDYKKEDVDVIKWLTGLAKSFEAKIDVLHVYRSEKFKQQLIDAGLQGLIREKIEYPHIKIHSIKKSNTIKGIAEFSKISFADLVVFIKKEKYFFQDLLHKSTVEKALKKLDLPILILKK
ncbi:MAG: universal stress protein [Prolixibacteraceae bacterium]|nr:universal stress protein [Prolixibacteraceae bacterium]